MVAKKIHEFIKNTRSGTLGLTGTILLIFVGILSLVIVYAWKKGLFEWNRKPSGSNQTTRKVVCIHIRQPISFADRFFKFF